MDSLLLKKIKTFPYCIKDILNHTEDIRLDVIKEDGLALYFA